LAPFGIRLAPPSWLERFYVHDLWIPFGSPWLPLAEVDSGTLQYLMAFGPIRTFWDIVGMNGI